MAARVLVIAVLMTALIGSTAAGPWMRARASWYTGWQFGSCGYGKNLPKPEYIAAWPDAQFGHRSICGKCFEVKCVNETVSTRSGALNRRHACKRPKTIQVKITDTCPKVHNQQWCGGDMVHLDLSRVAFEALAPSRHGIIPLRIREVQCSGSNYVKPCPSKSFKVGTYKQCGGAGGQCRKNSDKPCKDAPWPKACCPPGIKCKKITGLHYQCEN